MGKSRIDLPAKQQTREATILASYNRKDFTECDWELLEAIADDCVALNGAVPAHVHCLAARLQGGEVHVVSEGLVFGVYDTRAEADDAAFRACEKYLGNFEVSEHSLCAETRREGQDG